MKRRNFTVFTVFLSLLTNFAAVHAFLTPTPVPEHQVLMINVHGTSYDADGYSVYETLVNAGADADWVNLSSDGQAAQLINENTYDQIWIFDLSHSTDNYPTDWQAVADWFNDDPSRAVICDARIISSYWNGRHTSEGQNLTENYYGNMKLHGGGLMLGTDHSSYVSGINTVNSLIGLNMFFGNFNLTFIPVDTENPLMYHPNDMGTELWDDSTPGQTPYGLQPNGRILYTVAWHSGNPDTPGISSTIEGVIGYHVNITNPPDESSFYDELITFEAEGTGGNPPYSFEWSSNIDGDLGTGPGIQVHTDDLTYGIHTITVFSTDLYSRTDDDSINITVSAPTATPTMSPTPTEPQPVPAVNTAGAAVLMLLVGSLIATKSFGRSEK